MDTDPKVDAIVRLYIERGARKYEEMNNSPARIIGRL
jgi:hypothetical protein